MTSSDYGLIMAIVTSLAKVPYQSSTAITGQRFVFIREKNREKGEKAKDREIERLKI